MSFHDPNMRGGAAVGVIDDLPEVEAILVQALRLRCDGPDGPWRLHDILVGRFGTRRGLDCLGALERLLDPLLNDGRRALMRHGVPCRCVGADEAPTGDRLDDTSEGPPPSPARRLH